MMKITEILDKNAIEVSLNVQSKGDLLDKMILLAESSGKILNTAEAKREILEREKIMSTGVGKGIAIPHAKTNAVKDSIGALAILDEELDYQSLDGEPVKIVFMLIGRENNVGNHLRMLSKVSRLMNNDSFRNRLVKSKDREEVFELIESLDERE